MKKNDLNLSQRYAEKLNNMNLRNEVNFDNILLQLELTNACNHRCVFCPNSDSKREKKQMELTFAKSIIKECSEFLGKGKKICFHMNGECLLHPNIVELVGYSKLLGYEYIFITTNGSKANEKLLKALFDAGLDSIKFSINAGTRESYEKIHGKDDFNAVMRALEFSSEYRRESGLDYKIYVSYVVTKYSVAEMMSFKNNVKELCDELLFYYPCAYAGQRPDVVKNLSVEVPNREVQLFKIEHNAPCSVLWNSINVTCEGYLSLCCSEADNKLIIEDCNKMGIRDAWCGNKMNQMRKKHRSGDIKDTPCYGCINEEEIELESMSKEIFELVLKEHTILES